MALFESPRLGRREDPIIGSDAATRALSVTAVENDFVDGRLREARVGLRLHLRPDAARRAASRRFSGWASSPGDRVLEVGVGTGINAALYPPNCVGHRHRPVRARCSRRRASALARKGIRNVRLLEMDAADLKFADDSFDIVYAPVPDQRRARSGRRGARDAPRLPARRPHHHPQPLPQRESGRGVASSARSRRSPSTSASSRTSTCRRSSRRPTPARSRSKRSTSRGSGRSSLASRTELSRLWLALVVALFCLPLFVGLGRADLETTKRSIPSPSTASSRPATGSSPRAVPNDDWRLPRKAAAEVLDRRRADSAGPAAAQRVRPALLGRALRRPSPSSTSSRSAAGSPVRSCGAVAVLAAVRPPAAAVRARPAQQQHGRRRSSSPTAAACSTSWPGPTSARPAGALAARAGGRRCTSCSAS